MIAGMARRKEYVAAVFLSTPMNNAVEIVDPVAAAPRYLEPLAMLVNDDADVQGLVRYAPLFAGQGFEHGLKPVQRRRPAQFVDHVLFRLGYDKGGPDRSAALRHEP